MIIGAAGRRFAMLVNHGVNMSAGGGAHIRDCSNFQKKTTAVENVQLDGSKSFGLGGVIHEVSITGTLLRIKERGRHLDGGIDGAKKVSKGGNETGFQIWKKNGGIFKDWKTNTSLKLDPGEGNFQGFSSFIIDSPVLQEVHDLAFAL